MDFGSAGTDLRALYALRSRDGVELPCMLRTIEPNFAATRSAPLMTPRG